MVILNHTMFKYRRLIFKSVIAFPNHSVMLHILLITHVSQQQKLKKKLWRDWSVGSLRLCSTRWHESSVRLSESDSQTLSERIRERETRQPPQRRDQDRNATHAHSWHGLYQYSTYCYAKMFFHGSNLPIAYVFLSFLLLGKLIQA